MQEQFSDEFEVSLNRVLAADNAQFTRRPEREIPEEQERAEKEVVVESDVQSSPVYEDIFTEVTTLQAGCLKYTTGEEPVFVPVFPCLYQSL